MPSGGAAIKLPAANIAKIARIMRIDARNLHERRGPGKTCVMRFTAELLLTLVRLTFSRMSLAFAPRF